MEDNKKWKATVVFFSIDALGHIHPILSIARELRLRGYRAIILTTRPLSMGPRLTALGFELEHCENKIENPSESEKLMSSIMQPLMDLFRKGPKSAFESTYKLDPMSACNKHLDDMISKHDIIEAKLKSLEPDLIVFDHIIGVPCATTVARRWVRVYSGFPGPLYSSYNEKYVSGLGLRIEEMSPEMKKFELDAKKPLREKIRRFFAEKGAEDWPRDLDLSPTSPHLNFYLGPKELGLDQVELNVNPLPVVWFRLEHTIDGNDDVSVFEIPQSLSDYPGKLIYFSLGTLVTSDVQLINRLLEILSKSPNKFIVSKGEMHNHVKLFPNMWGEKFVEQKGILPKVDLFITHGGHNSIIEAFYYGVPGLIVLPVFADQFDSAQRVQDCGFGIRLNPFTCTERELLGSIDSLLIDKDLRSRMQAIGSRLRKCDYHRIAADKIENLLKA